MQQIAQLLNLERSIGRAILLVSADRDHYRLTVNAIHLRQVSDHRPDALTKAAILAGIQERYEIVHAYDDRAEVARLPAARRRHHTDRRHPGSGPAAGGSLTVSPGSGSAHMRTDPSPTDQEHQ